MAYQYALVIWYSEEDEAYLVDVPELPGCMADGETIEEAIHAAQAAIQMWVEAARKLGRPVPRSARSRGEVQYLLEFGQPATWAEIERQMEGASESEMRYHQVRELGCAYNV